MNKNKDEYLKKINIFEENNKYIEDFIELEIQNNLDVSIGNFATITLCDEEIFSLIKKTKGNLKKKVKSTQTININEPVTLPSFINLSYDKKENKKNVDIKKILTILKDDFNKISAGGDKIGISYPDPENTKLFFNKVLKYIITNKIYNDCNIPIIIGNSEYNKRFNKTVQNFLSTNIIRQHESLQTFFEFQVVVDYIKAQILNNDYSLITILIYIIQKIFNTDFEITSTKKKCPKIASGNNIKPFNLDEVFSTPGETSILLPKTKLDLEYIKKFELIETFRTKSDIEKHINEDFTDFDISELEKSELVTKINSIITERSRIKTNPYIIYTPNINDDIYKEILNMNETKPETIKKLIESIKPIESEPVKPAKTVKPEPVESEPDKTLKSEPDKTLKPKLAKLVESATTTATAPATARATAPATAPATARATTTATNLGKTATTTATAPATARAKTTATARATTPATARAKTGTNLATGGSIENLQLNMNHLDSIVSLVESIQSLRYEIDQYKMNSQELEKIYNTFEKNKNNINKYIEPQIIKFPDDIIQIKEYKQEDIKKLIKKIGSNPDINYYLKNMLISIYSKILEKIKEDEKLIFDYNKKNINKLILGLYYGI